MELYTAAWANARAQEAYDKRIMSENAFVLEMIKQATDMGWFSITLQPEYLTGNRDFLSWLEDRGFNLYYKDGYIWKNLRSMDFPITDAKEYRISWRIA